MMRIISWNVNGIRAVHRKGNFEWLVNNSPDTFCIQETKAHPDQLPEEVRNPAGYYSYFNHSEVKKGYSGTAIYTKDKPVDVFYGIGKEKDPEGRVVGLEFKDFFLLNIYFPNGGGGPERLAYKLKFYDDFLKFIEKLRKHKPVIFCGDVNTAHKEADLARPKENETNTGFLPEERAWIDRVVEKGYIDTFRHLFPEKKDSYTYWDMKTFARDRNVGWRIDYFFVSPDLKDNIKSLIVHDDIFGSDHCPIELDINL